jgi:hypothetical protein
MADPNKLENVKEELLNLGQSVVDNRVNNLGVPLDELEQKTNELGVSRAEFIKKNAPDKPSSRKTIGIILFSVAILAAIIIPLIIYRHKIFGKPKKTNMSGGTIKLNKKRKIRLNKTERI